MAFLRLNGTRIRSTQNDLYDLVIGVAEGRVSKAAVAVFFEQRASSE
jgi:prophage maintenance system killer protein